MGPVIPGLKARQDHCRNRPQEAKFCTFPVNYNQGPSGRCWGALGVLQETSGLRGGCLVAQKYNPFSERLKLNTDFSFEIHWEPEFESTDLGKHLFFRESQAKH